jgi:hypothetical protein
MAEYSKAGVSTYERAFSPHAEIFGGECAER